MEGMELNTLTDEERSNQENSDSNEYCDETSISSKNLLTADSEEGSSEAINMRLLNRLAWPYIKNLLVISFSFLLLFTAFSSTSNLQSTINAVDGLGVASLATIYAAFIVSCLVLPPLVIPRLGNKWTIVVSMVTYSVYVLANVHATWATLLPTAALLGFGASTLWTANNIYIRRLATECSRVLGREDPEHIMSLFFGIFFALFHSSGVWGNLIAGYVIGYETEHNSPVPAAVVRRYCGPNFCNADTLRAANISIDNLARPSDHVVTVLFLTYFLTACGAAVFTALFLARDPPAKEGLTPDDREGLVGEGLKGKEPSLGSTARDVATHMRRPEQMLLVPLTMFAGLQSGFLGSEFTKAYVACGWGIHTIAWVMMLYAVVDAAMSYVLGAGVRYVGRRAVFLGAGTFHAGLLVSLYFWEPEGARAMDDEGSGDGGASVIYLLAVAWASCDAVWQAQNSALYGVVFSSCQEAAFANRHMWESLGFMCAFLISEPVCIRSKLLNLGVFLALGIAGYITVETRYLGRRRATR